MFFTSESSPENTFHALDSLSRDLISCKRMHLSGQDINWLEKLAEGVSELSRLCSITLEQYFH